MSLKEGIVIMLGTLLLLAGVMGAFLLFLQRGTTPAETPTVNCTDPNSELCKLKNYFNAQSADDAVSKGCIQAGLPADCADF